MRFSFGSLQKKRGEVHGHVCTFAGELRFDFMGSGEYQAIGHPSIFFVVSFGSEIGSKESRDFELF